MKSLDGLYIPVKGHTNVFALLGNRDKYRPFLKKSEVGGKSGWLLCKSKLGSKDLNSKNQAKKLGHFILWGKVFGKKGNFERTLRK